MYISSKQTQAGTTKIRRKNEEEKTKTGSLLLKLAL
jgi:hypothetical protein